MKNLIYYPRLALLFLSLFFISSSQASSSLSASQSLLLLKDGNRHFLLMKLKHPNTTIHQRQYTAAHGQQPFAIVLACSDSRIPVEMIFDRGVGDIFVVRVAGNAAVDDSVTGSLEYAVDHLQVPLLVILGHTKCGAIQAGMSETPVKGHLQTAQKRIAKIAAAEKASHPTLNDEELSALVTQDNVLHVKQDLLKNSESLRNAVNKKQLTIVTAIYDTQTGAVHWID